MERIKPDIIRKVSNDLIEEIVKDEALKAVQACFQCGTCSGGCPSGRRTALRTRKVIRKVIQGLDEVLKDEDIWLCSTCYTCFERCPRNIPITDVIIKLRNMASKRGYMLAPHKQLTYLLIQTGHGVPLGGTDNNWTKLRVSYGLTAIPPTTHCSPDSVKEVETLIKDTGFDKLVGWPPAPAPAAAPAAAPKPEEKKEIKK